MQLLASNCKYLICFSGRGLATPWHRKKLSSELPTQAFSSLEIHVPLNNHFLLKLFQLRTFYPKSHLWVIPGVCFRRVFSLSSLSFFKYPMPLCVVAGGRDVLYSLPSTRLLDPPSSARGLCVIWACLPGKHRIHAFLLPDRCTSEEILFPSAYPDTQFVYSSVLTSSLVTQWFMSLMWSQFRLELS